MRQRLLARHCAVPPAADTGGGAARRRQRLEAEPGEEACSASIPWVGHHEGARSLMQCTETDSLVALVYRHGVSPVSRVVGGTSVSVYATMTRVALALHSSHLR